MKAGDSFRCISDIRRSPSSARVMDLLDLHDRVRAAGDADKRFFASENLNRTIIIKHRLRTHEAQIFQFRRTVATKLFLPYNNRSLREGGRSFFVREEGWRDVLRDHFAVTPGNPAGDRDIEILELIDSVPSLDPFILFERMRMVGMDVDREFFQISPGEYERIKKMIEAEFYALARLAFADTDNVPARTYELVARMWNARNADGILPLIRALRIEAGEAAAVLFAWKGFIYYKSSLTQTQEQFTQFLTDVRALQVVNFADNHQRSAVADLKRMVLKGLAEAMKTIAEGVADYDRHFRGELIERRNPAKFREFLERSPKYFAQIGAALAAVNHAVSFWNYRFGRQAIKMCNADEFLDMLRDFGEGTGAA